MATPSSPNSAPLDGALRRAHRSVLLGLATCALVAFLQPGEPETAPPPVPYTMTAAVLAAGTILTRRFGTSPKLSPKVRVFLTLTAFGLATLLGLLGAGLAIATGASSTGLLFTLGAGLICLRPPEPVAPRAPRGDKASC